MAWTTIPSTDLDPESPLTTSLMNALYDNVAAALNRDSGAPAVGTGFITSASQLGAGVVDTSELIDGAVEGAKLNTAPLSSGGWAVPAASSYTPASGFYNVAFDTASTNNPFWEIFVSAAWRGATSNSFTGNVQFCDGSNMRINSVSSGAVTLYYQKF